MKRRLFLKGVLKGLLAGSAVPAIGVPRGTKADVFPKDSVPDSDWSYDVTKEEVLSLRVNKLLTPEQITNEALTILNNNMNHLKYLNGESTTESDGVFDAMRVAGDPLKTSPKSINIKYDPNSDWVWIETNKLTGMEFMKVKAFK